MISNRFFNQNLDKFNQTRTLNNNDKKAPDEYETGVITEEEVAPPEEEYSTPQENINNSNDILSEYNKTLLFLQNSEVVNSNNINFIGAVSTYSQFSSTSTPTATKKEIPTTDISSSFAPTILAPKNETLAESTPNNIAEQNVFTETSNIPKHEELKELIPTPTIEQEETTIVLPLHEQTTTKETSSTPIIVPEEIPIQTTSSPALPTAISPGEVTASVADASNLEAFLINGGILDSNTDLTTDTIYEIFSSDKYNITTSKDEFDETIYSVTDKNGNNIVSISQDWTGTSFTYKQEDGTDKTYTIIDNYISSIDDKNITTYYSESGKVSNIYDKKSGINTFYDEDGNIASRRNDNGQVIDYNKDGSINKIKESEESIKSNVQTLHESFAKGNLTAENVKDLLENNTNKWNIVNVLDSYLKNYNENLISVIAEQNLGGSNSFEIATLLKNSIIEYYNAQGIYTEDIEAMMSEYINRQSSDPNVTNIDLSGLLTYQTYTDELGNVTQNKKNGFIERLETRLNTQKENDGIDANGKIDEAFSQGATGDCWLVSAIKTLASNPETKAMLEDLISVDKDGNVNVNLKHVGKTYSISKEELSSADEYSNGDLDVRALEIAMNKYFHETGLERNFGGTKVDDITDGNFSGLAFDILLGSKTTDEQGYSHTWIKNIEELQDILKDLNGEMICTTGTDIYTEDTAYLTTTTGELKQLAKPHAYSITSADDKFVYLVNPWDSEITLKVTHDEFLTYFGSVYKADLKELREKNPEFAAINGGTLEQVDVLGKAGKSVSIYDNYTFKATTSDNGFTYYQVRDEEGNLTFIAAEVFEELIKNDPNRDVKSIVDSLGVRNLKELGEQLEQFKKILNELNEDSGSNNSTSSSQATNKSQDGLFEGVGLNINNYINNDGKINIAKLTQDWKASGGEVYDYNGKATQNAFSSLLNGSKDGDYSSFWKNASSFNTNHFEGIDNFNMMSVDATSNYGSNISENEAPGFGGGSGGGSGTGSGGGNGPLDWKNAGLRFESEVQKTTNRNPISEDKDAEE